jgi:hypothetical protein
MRQHLRESDRLTALGSHVALGLDFIRAGLGIRGGHAHRGRGLAHVFRGRGVVAVELVEEIDRHPHRPARARQAGDLPFTRLAKVDAREPAAACARAKKRNAKGIQVRIRPQAQGQIVLLCGVQSETDAVFLRLRQTLADNGSQRHAREGSRSRFGIRGM